MEFTRKNKIFSTSLTAILFETGSHTFVLAQEWTRASVVWGKIQANRSSAYLFVTQLWQHSWLYIPMKKYTDFSLTLQSPFKSLHKIFTVTVPMAVLLQKVKEREVL